MRVFSLRSDVTPGGQPASRVPSSAHFSKIRDELVGGVGKTLTLDLHPKIQRRHWENLLPGTGGLAPDLPQRGYNCIPESGSM